MNIHELEELQWRTEFRKIVRSREELRLKVNLNLKKGHGDPEERTPPFSCRVPESFIHRIKKNDLSDPLLLQVYPQTVELETVEGFTANPLKEQPISALPILKKYPSRALWLITQVCAIHCRYCFRRETSFSEIEASSQDWDAVIEAFHQMADLKEVILSGGDPLILPTSMILQAIRRLETLPHLQMIRIHTRMPIVIPSRITSQLCQGLAHSKCSIIIVVHCNHPNELTEEIKASVDRLKKAGALVLNQSVLLRGVNDDVKTLALLSEKLFSCGILPYYLHALDPVKGAAHFHVPLAEGKCLMKGLLERLPGYLVPKFVQEIPGDLSKRPIPVEEAL